MKNKDMINPLYVHFAIKDGKVWDAWEQSEDISFWSKLDLKDNFPDNKPSKFKVLHLKTLLRRGFNPFDTKNWHK